MWNGYTAKRTLGKVHGNRMRHTDGDGDKYADEYADEFADRHTECLTDVYTERRSTGTVGNRNNRTAT